MQEKMTRKNVNARIRELQRKIKQADGRKETLPRFLAVMIDTSQDKKDLKILQALTDDDIEKANKANEDNAAIFKYPYK